MKLNPKLLSGIWFCIGTITIVVIVLLKLHQPDPDPVPVLIILLSGSMSSFYFGRSFGELIITKEIFSIKKLAHVMLYGWQIAIATLYIIFFSMSLIGYFTESLPIHIHAKDYYSIITDILLVPIMALFATLLGCILEPIILISSGLGAIALFILRFRFLFLCEKASH